MSNNSWTLPGFANLLGPKAASAPVTPAPAAQPAPVTTTVDLNDPNAKIFSCSDGCGQKYSQAEIDAAMAWTPGQP